MNNLKAVLEAAGSELNNVVKFNIYLTDMANFGAVNEVYVTYLTDKKPVSLSSIDGQLEVSATTLTKLGPHLCLCQGAASGHRCGD